MKFLLSAFALAILVLSVSSCSIDIVDDGDDDQPVGPYDTLTINDADDVAKTPDFKSLTFYLYDDSIKLAVELWEPHDSTNYPSDYMFFVYLYSTNHEAITFNLHDYNIRRDNEADGMFEELLAEGDIIWSKGRSIASIVYDRAIMPDFETKEVWAYSMASLDHMPDNGGFFIADSLSGN